MASFEEADAASTSSSLTCRFSQCFESKGVHEEQSEGARTHLVDDFPVVFTAGDPRRPSARTADTLTTVQFDATGEYLATGDKGGRIVVFQRDTPSGSSVRRRARPASGDRRERCPNSGRASDTRDLERARARAPSQEGLSRADLHSRRAEGKGARREGVSASTMGRSLLESDRGTHAADTSFWVPQLTPEASVKLSKPDPLVRCPVTNHPLKLKLLHAVSFTPADGDGDIAARRATERYICPLTKKALSNINPAAVLRPSGKVVSVSAVEQIVRKDMLDPFTEPPSQLREKDIIKLRVEGTGFAAKTDEKQLKVSAVQSAAPRF